MAQILCCFEFSLDVESGDSEGSSHGSLIVEVELHPSIDRRIIRTALTYAYLSPRDLGKWCAAHCGHPHPRWLLYQGHGQEPRMMTLPQSVVLPCQGNFQLARSSYFLASALAECKRESSSIYLHLKESGCVLNLIFPCRLQLLSKDRF